MLDRCAPEKVVKRTWKPPKLWLNHTLCKQWKIVKTEKELGRNISSNTTGRCILWKEIETFNYSTISKTNQSISKKALDCNEDTKELFHLVNTLNCNTTQNPMPLNKTDEELAEDFAEFFLSEIEKNKGKFINTPANKPVQQDIPKFVSFRSTHRNGSMYSYNEDEEQALWIEHHPKKYPQANNRGLLSHHYTYCQPISNKRRILWRMENSHCQKNLTWTLKTESIDQYQIYPSSPNLWKNACSNNSWIIVKSWLATRFYISLCKHYITETNLIKLTNDILWSMERQQITAITISDLLAAFDMVDHEILLQILEQRFGFCGKSLH